MIRFESVMVILFIFSVSSLAILVDIIFGVCVTELRSFTNMCQFLSCALFCSYIFAI